MSENVNNEVNAVVEEPIAVEDIKPPTRFEVEIEFVNSLSNINYVNYLIKNKNLLQDQAFLKYLKYLYLTYACNTDFKKYIIYPNCLVLLTIIIDNMFDNNTDIKKTEAKKEKEEDEGSTININIDKVLQQLNDPKLFKDMYDRFNEQ